MASICVISLKTCWQDKSLSVILTRSMVCADALPAAQTSANAIAVSCFMLMSFKVWIRGALDQRWISLILQPLLRNRLVR